MSIGVLHQQDDLQSDCIAKSTENGQDVDVLGYGIQLDVSAGKYDEPKSHPAVKCGTTKDDGHAIEELVVQHTTA